MKYCNAILSCMLEAALTFTDKTWRAEASGEQNEVFLTVWAARISIRAQRVRVQRQSLYSQGWKKYGDFMLEFNWMLSILLH